MNSQKYFSQIENDKVRSDEFEGTTSITQPNEIDKLTITSPDGKQIIFYPQDFEGPLKIGTGSHNIFCVFSITDVDLKIPLIDPRNLEFGDSFILVTSTKQFLERFSKHAALSNYSYGWDKVGYYDHQTHSGETGVFRKPSPFAYQNEFRLVIAPGKSEPIILTLGSLINITSEIYPLSQINDLVKFVPSGA